MQSSIDSAGWIRQIVRIIPGDPRMTIARAHLVDPAVTRWYHCITRCVRRAFLLAEGLLDRKHWIEHRLEELAQIFSVSVAGFTAMDNHLHVLVRLDPQVAAGSDLLIWGPGGLRGVRVICLQKRGLRDPCLNGLDSVVGNG